MTDQTMFDFTPCISLLGSACESVPIGNNQALTVTIEVNDGVEHMEIINREMERRGHLPEIKKPSSVAHIIAIVDGERGKPLVAELDQEIAIPMPELPGGGRLDPIAEADLLAAITAKVMEGQELGWGLFSREVDATCYHWPDPGYLRYLLRSTGLSRAVVRERLDVAERTLRYWLDPLSPNQIPFVTQFALEVLAKQGIDRQPWSERWSR